MWLFSNQFWSIDGYLLITDLPDSHQEPSEISAHLDSIGSMLGKVGRGLSAGVGGTGGEGKAPV